jgi:hypothetical protein
MSEVMRYAVIETALCIGGNLHDGEVLMVRADDHDRQLAALREELAKVTEDRDAWRKRSTRRLADCQEMRNALNEIEGCKDTDAALLATDTLAEIYRREKLNPTESGASE